MKKTRRMGPVAPAAEGGVVAAAAPRRGGSVAQQHIPTTEELNEEYRYVTKDLQWIGILAAVMMTLLVALSIGVPLVLGG